ncbi:hypothetical protein ABRY23_09850 [Melioribacteraceae bacterium 4301-Me]|uniref:hypothetical protein n=1 Tax=Pyranulibacter aquaticus TaxID=3163344 RepID=UPI003596E1BB
MIEIKITIDDAVKLLLERMSLELANRQKAGIILKGVRLEQLTYQELIAVIEAAVFDTIILLPVELLLTDTNLETIITKTIHALSKILGREELNLYSHKRTKKLIQHAIQSIKKAIENSDFQSN